MDEVFGFTKTIIAIVENLVNSFTELLPRLLTALIVILIGILIAKIIEKALRTAFAKLGLDALFERFGVKQSLEKIGLQDPPGRLISRAIYFLLVLLFIQSASQAVGLLAISNAIGSFFAYMPHLIAAMLVLLFGMMVAQFAGKLVTRSAAESGIDYAPTLGRMVSALIGFVVVLMAITQLKIDIDIIRSVVLVLLSGLAIAISLSFGLGTRDVTRNIVAGFYARKLFTVGEEIEIGGERGVLTAFTPLQTLIDSDGQTKAIPNRVFLDEVVKQ